MFGAANQGGGLFGGTGTGTGIFGATQTTQASGSLFGKPLGKPACIVLNGNFAIL